MKRTTKDLKEIINILKCIRTLIHIATTDKYYIRRDSEHPNIQTTIGILYNNLCCVYNLNDLVFELQTTRCYSDEIKLLDFNIKLFELEYRVKGGDNNER